MKRKIRQTGGLTLSSPDQGERLISGQLQVDVARRIVRVAGNLAELPPKVFDLLLVFLREPRVVHTRESLFERLWPDTVLLDANLTTALSQLRRALDAETRRLVRTVSRVGYAYDGEVERVFEPLPSALPLSAGESDRRQESAVPSAVASAAPVSSAVTTLQAPSPHGRQPRRLLAWSAAGLALLVLAGLLFFSTITRSERPILVIGTIRANAGTSTSGWVGMALRDALNRRLAAYAALRVVDSETTQGTVLARDAGSAPSHGADFVIEVTYGVTGQPVGSVDIQWQLQRLADRSVVLRKTTTFDTPDLLVAIDRIVGDVGEIIGLAAHARLDGAASIPTAAVEAYAQGLDAQQQFDLNGARAHFTQAMQRAPDFALAELRLAEVLQRQGYHLLSASHLRRLAEQPGLGEETHRIVLARAAAADRQWPEAVQRYRELVTLHADDPRHSLELAAALTEGDIAQRREARQILSAIAPRMGLAQWEVQRLLQIARIDDVDGQLDDAHTLLVTAQSLAERGPFDVLAAQAYNDHGRVQLRRGQRDSARTLFEHARDAAMRAHLPINAQLSALNVLFTDIDRDSGSRPEIKRRISLMMAEAERMGASEAVGRGAMGMADLSLFSYDFLAARDAAAQAIAIFTDLQNGRMADAARVQLAQSHIALLRPATALSDLAPLAQALAGKTPQRVRYHQLTARALAESGKPDEAMSHARTASAIYDKTTNPDQFALSACQIADFHRAAHELDQASDTIADCIAFDEVELRMPGALIANAEIALEAGRFGKFEPALRRAVLAVGERVDDWETYQDQSDLATLLVRIGAFDDARIRLALADAVSLGDAAPRIYLSHATAHIALAAYGDGDFATARGWLAKARQQTTDESVVANLKLDLLDVALTDPATRPGRREALLTRTRASMERYGMRDAVVQADRLAAALATASSTPPDGSWWMLQQPLLLAGGRLREPALALQIKRPRTAGMPR